MFLSIDGEARFEVVKRCALGDALNAKLGHFYELPVDDEHDFIVEVLIQLAVSL